MQKVVTAIDHGVAYYRGCFRAAMAWSRVSQEPAGKDAPLSEKKQERGETTDYSKNDGEGSSTC